MEELIGEITQLAKTVSVPLILGYLAYKITDPSMRPETAFIDAIFIIIIFTSVASAVMAQVAWALTSAGLMMSTWLGGTLSLILTAAAMLMIARFWPRVWRWIDNSLSRF